jgi:signal transduction histidine kinase
VRATLADVTSTASGQMTRAPIGRFRRLRERSLHRVLYTLLFALVAVGIATLVVPPMRLYSGAHEQIIALTMVMLLVVEFASTRLHRFVDWLLYGQRNDPAAASARLARPLSDADDQHILEALLGALADTLRLTYVAVSVPDGQTIAVGTDASAGSVTFPIRRAGQSLGQLLAARRGQPLDERDERLLEAAAAQVGLVLYARGLTEEIRAAREELVLGIEEERRRLRHEIHDGIGPTLAGIALGVESATRAVDRDPSRARQLLTDVGSDVTGLVSEVRQVVDGLRPALLDELGIAGALRGLARTFEERTGCRVEVEAVVPPSLPAAVEVAAYRIGSEALTNVARHARAGRARVTVGVEGQALVVVVIDDGLGGAADRPGGTGMTSMRQRAAEVGGTVEVDSTRAGTRLTARLPLKGSRS